MSGLLRRLTQRRAPTAGGSDQSAAAASGGNDAHAPADAVGRSSLLVDPPSELTLEQPAARAEPVGASEPATPAARAEPVGDPEPATPAAPVSDAAPGHDLPAGLDPAELGRPLPTSARRGRLRRRAGFLRAAREVLLRDLGGFVYELHRVAGEIEHDTHRRLRESKLARLATIDAELRDLEARLGEPRAETVLREPGVGGACPECGELHASDANWCANCGAPLSAGARRRCTEEEERLRAAEGEPAAAGGEAVPHGGGGSPARAEAVAPADEAPTAALPPVPADDAEPAADNGQAPAGRAGEAVGERGA